MRNAMNELFPPDIPPVTRWRFAHFILGIILLVFMLWALGAFIFFGFPGFARASDLQEKVEEVTVQLTVVNREIQTLKVDQLEQRIYDAERLRCSATTSESRRFYAGQVAKMNRDYFSFTGVPLLLPDCKELG